MMDFLLLLEAFSLLPLNLAIQFLEPNVFGSISLLLFNFAIQLLEGSKDPARLPKKNIEELRVKSADLFIRDGTWEK